jgi:flavodoxin
MKTAVVFYSLDGNCAFVAEQIKAQLNADLLQLQTVDDKKRGGFGKMLWGVGMVFGNKKPALKPYTFDPAAYDLIIIGAPVWASSPAPIMKTFLSQTNLSGKKIALFVCHAGGKGNSIDKFKALLPGTEIAAATDFTPVKVDKETLKQQIADWSKGLGA